MSNIDALLTQLNQLNNRLLSIKESGLDGFHRVLQNATSTSTITGPLDSGNTAWMLASSALVLFMTIPGLAIYYGKLVTIS